MPTLSRKRNRCENWALKKMNKIKKCFWLIAGVLFAISAGWTQELHEGLEPELEMQLKESEEAEEKASQPDELQKNFVIIEPFRVHELNPQITQYSSDSQILCGLYEGLFSYHPVTLEPQYAIATGYKISRDKKRWTITLRPEACFSNGESITAASVRDSWLQLLSTPNAPYASLLDIIRGAEAYRTGSGTMEDVGIYAVDEHTLSIYLNKPANYLPKVLCHSAFAVIHRNPTVYSGPFTLEDYDEVIYILKKNPKYWDAENVKLQQITFIQSEDKEANTYVYNIGQADWITSSVETEKILDSGALQFNTEFATSYYFFKNSAAKPSRNPSVWDYPEFRSAVLEAFPWEEVRGAAMVPATTFVYPLQGYPQIEGFSYTDQIEASLKMKDAREKYGIPAEQILPLTFAVSEYTLADDKLDAIKTALEPLGIDFIVQKCPSNYYLASVTGSEADLFAYTWIGDFADPLAFLELFHGDSTLNDSGWKSAEYDRLLDEAAMVSDKERPELLGKAEEILLESGMVLPIYHPVCFNLIDLKEVGGWSTNAFDIHPLKYLFKKQQPVNALIVKK